MSDFDNSDQELDDIQVSPGSAGGETIPEELPILPLRGLVVFPKTAIPLTIGQPRSIKLVDDVVTGNRLVGLVTSKVQDIENPSPEHLNAVGTVGIIHRMFRAPDNTIRLLVQGMERFRLKEFTALEPYLKARIEIAPEDVETGLEVEALLLNARKQFEHIADLLPTIPRELLVSLSSVTDPLVITYTIANFQRMEIEDAQKILEINSLTEKLKRLVTILTHETEVLELGQKIQNQARSEIETVQRQYFLREQLKAIQRELGDTDEQTIDLENFSKRIDEACMPEEAANQARRELDRLAHLPVASAEYGVIRTYLDWLTGLPWSKATQDNLDIPHAREVLEEDHYGLKDIKERILEFLAVRKLRQERGIVLSSVQEDIHCLREGVILCFVGPPGVGKTSLGQSISRALGRKFIRVSLGGIRDEAEIRGHRRTYIGAMPGRIIQSIKRVESKNPVFMLDEIDKLTMDFHGDPASALLEVLDPEQNREFRDNYLEVPFDLSQIMFITTANQLETIPLALLDRMEVIRLSGYTENEKIAIARNYLVPRQIKENGLRMKELSFSTDGLKTIIRSYTREAGVRNLERQIGRICRKTATRITEGKPVQKKVDTPLVQEILGKPLFHHQEEISRRLEVPGVATGLAWTPVGGDILFIEATRMPGSKGFKITGSVGEVMQESAQAALSYIRANCNALGIDPDIFEKIDIHLHIPSGAQPKDGPSAGVTIAAALVSLLTAKNVLPTIGMTGEITLSGQVLPVGGIKEKVLAAYRSGLKTVILPELNLNDLEDLPEEVKKHIRFLPVKTIHDVLISAIAKK